MANDNATTTPDELPADGPWNMDPLKLSQTLGNTHNPISDAGNGALVPDIDAPWALTGEQLAQITNNKKPPPPPAKPIDPSTQGEPFSFSSLFAKLVNTESGGKHLDANGNLLSSNKNAKGITQVIPATGTSPGFGVTPLQNDSVEEYLRFGKDYLTAMIRNFGGNVQQGVAAYNAGPASVQKAITKAQAAGDQSSWLSFLPKETQKYVARIAGNALAVATGSTNANAAADFRDYLTTNKVETGPTAKVSQYGKNPGVSYETQTNKLGVDMVKTIQDKFPQFIDAINTQVRAQPAQDGATAEYSPMTDQINLGKVQGSLTTWKDAMGNNTKSSPTGVDPGKANEALTTTLHELMHARFNKIGSFNDGIGPNWKDMLNDASDAGFPSVYKGSNQTGDDLNEFLATATTLKEMQRQNIAPGGRYVAVAQALPGLEKKYPWLKQYIINYINPEAAANASNRAEVEKARNKK